MTRIEKLGWVLTGWSLMIIFACVQHLDPVSSFCPTAVHPDTVTRAWLQTLTPPPEAVHYFKLIGNEQKAIEEACP